MKHTIFALALLALVSCGKEQSPPAPPVPPIDPSKQFAGPNGKCHRVKGFVKKNVTVAEAQQIAGYVIQNLESP